MIERGTYRKDKDWLERVEKEAKTILEEILQDRVVIRAKDISSWKDVGKDWESHAAKWLLGSTKHRMGSIELRKAVEDLLMKCDNKFFHGTRVVPITEYAFKTYRHMPTVGDIQNRMATRALRKNLEEETITEFRRCVAGHRSAEAYHVVLPSNVKDDPFLAMLDGRRWSMGVRSIKPIMTDLVKSEQLGLLPEGVFSKRKKEIENMLDTNGSGGNKLN